MDYPKSVIFNGKKYTRGERTRTYYVCHNKWKKPATFLHVDIWEFAYGKRPEGCHIHHKDGNRWNNAPENLQCLSSQDHKRLHMEGWQSKAMAWHASNEGLEWHKEHGKQVMAKR